MALRPAGYEFKGYVELEVVLQGEGKGPARLRMESPVGELEGELWFDLGRLEVEEALASATRTTDVYSVKRSHSPLETLDPIRDVGARLFSALFAGRRESYYRRTLQQAQEEGRGLRLRLAIDDPELAAMPWEFLYDGREFLGLSARTPVLRSPGVPQPARPLKPASKLRVLAVEADITGKLRTKEEVNRLRELAGQADQFELAGHLPDATRERLWDALRQGGFQVLHFVGTGIEAGEGQQALVMMARDGKPVRTPADLKPAQLLYGFHLVEMLRGVPDLRLVYLSACDTEVLAGDLAKAVPAVVGMRGKITNVACMAFMEGMYGALLEGQSLEAAVTAGRMLIDVRNPGSREWGLPVFYLQPAEAVFVRRAADETADVGVPASRDRRAAPDLPADSPRGREWRKLQMMLEAQQRNLEALAQQKGAYSGRVPEFVEAQIEEAEAQIADLEGRLDELEADA